MEQVGSPQWLDVVPKELPMMRGRERDGKREVEMGQKRWPRREVSPAGGQWRPGSGIGRNKDEHIDCSSLIDKELETEPGPSWHHLTTRRRLRDEIEHI